MNEGRFQRFNNAAWNWNGMYNTAIVTSARARFPIYRFITVRILRPLAEIKECRTILIFCILLNNLIFQSSKCYVTIIFETLRKTIKNEISSFDIIYAFTMKYFDTTCRFCMSIQLRHLICYCDIFN